MSEDKEIQKLEKEILELEEKLKKRILDYQERRGKENLPVRNMPKIGGTNPNWEQGREERLRYAIGGAKTPIEGKKYKRPRWKKNPYKYF